MKKGQMHANKCAMERLQYLIMSDCADCSPDMMKTLKEEVALIVEKYIEVEGSEISVKILEKSLKSGPVLHIEVPIINLKNISR